jgi:hypothetical protein
MTTPLPQASPGHGKRGGRPWRATTRALGGALNPHATADRGPIRSSCSTGSAISPIRTVQSILVIHVRATSRPTAHRTVRTSYRASPSMNRSRVTSRSTTRCRHGYRTRRCCSRRPCGSAAVIAPSHARRFEACCSRRARRSTLARRHAVLPLRPVGDDVIDDTAADQLDVLDGLRKTTRGFAGRRVQVLQRRFARIALVEIDRAS